MAGRNSPASFRHKSSEQPDVILGPSPPKRAKVSTRVVSSSHQTSDSGMLRCQDYQGSDRDVASVQASDAKSAEEHSLASIDRDHQGINSLNSHTSKSEKNLELHHRQPKGLRRTSAATKDRLALKMLNRASGSKVFRTRGYHRFSASDSLHLELLDVAQPDVVNSDLVTEPNYVSTHSKVKNPMQSSAGSSNLVKSPESLLPSAMRIFSPLLHSSHSYACVACSKGGDAEDGDPSNEIVRAHKLMLGRKNDNDSNERFANFSFIGPGLVCQPVINSSPSSPRIVQIETLFQKYYDACALYNCKPNAGVLAALRYHLPALRVTGAFFDESMLALAEILLEYSNTLLSHVKRLDFTCASREGKRNGLKGFQSHGAYALSRVLLQSKNISEVFVPRHKIGPYGASAIFRSCQHNPTIKVLALRRCMIGERGAEAFVKCIQSPSCGLLEVDLSNCGMGFRATKHVCDGLVEREHAGLHSIEVDLEGNLIFQEIMNAVTHGLGIIFAILGSILLCNRVNGRPFHYRLACGIYSLSVIFLYTCSTLYHSFFALRMTRYYFGIFDHCAIYILIAGSYTAYIGVSLTKETAWSLYLLAFIWVCSLLGVYVEAFHINWQHKPTFSLCMYLGLGWACMVCLPELVKALPRKSVHMLVMGGVGYTSGVPFFVRNNNLDHSIWHMFVLMASMFHWIGVYSYLGPP